MARPAVISIEDKFRLVCSVISGEMSIAEAARRGGVSEQSIGNWKRQFLEGGKQGLADGGHPGSNPQAQRVEAEIEDLKAALGEAHVELRMWKESAEGRLGPTQDLEVIRVEEQITGPPDPLGASGAWTLERMILATVCGLFLAVQR